MKAYDPAVHDVKQAIQKLEWALVHLEDYNDKLSAADPESRSTTIWVIDKCCNQIRDAYRELTELV